MLHKSDPDRAAQLAQRAQQAVDDRQVTYRYLAGQIGTVPTPDAPPLKQEKTP